MELSNRNPFAFLLRLTAITSSFILLMPQHGVGVAVPQMGDAPAADQASASSGPAAEPTRPPFPNKGACDAALVKGQPPKDKSALMTNLVARTQLQSAIQYAESNGLTHVLNDKPEQEVWKPANFTVTSNYDGTQGEMWQFQQDYSATFSQATSGKAYVLLGHNRKARANCTFYQTEFPVLRDSGKVDEIIWADYAPGIESSTPINEIDKVWWKKGDPPPEPDPISVHTKAPLCSSTKYPVANHCAINQAVDALAGTPESSSEVDAGDCNRVGCAGDTGIFVCNHQTQKIRIDNENIALSVDELQQSCDMYYDSPIVNCEEMPVPALEQAYDENFSILVKGGEKGCASLIPPVDTQGSTVPA